MGETDGDTELEYVALPVCDPDTQDVGEALTVAEIEGERVPATEGVMDKEMAAEGLYVP